MRKTIIYILITYASISACMSEKRVTFIHYELIDYKQERVKYYFKVPKGYQFRGIKADAEAGSEQQYWYTDSSVIYVTDFGGTINEANIRNQENAYGKRLVSDSISLNGTDSKGNHWKEIKYKGVLYGYSNVPKDKMQIFEKAIASVKNN